MPAGVIPLCMVEALFPTKKDGILIQSRMHNDDLLGQLLDNAALSNFQALQIKEGEYIPELEHLEYEGEMAPVALRALARRRYEARMERKAVRSERYHRRMARHRA